METIKGDELLLKSKNTISFRNEIEKERKKFKNNLKKISILIDKLIKIYDKTN